MQGEPTLEEETAEMTSLAEDIRQKAEQRGKAVKRKSVTEKRSYKLPAYLERRETIIEPEGVESDKLIKIGEDVRERLMLEPSKFWVERVVRPIYKEKQEAEAVSTRIHQATLPEVILPGCLAGETVLSQIIIDKFLYHLPEYRQAKRFKELGVNIGTSSVNRWVHSIADKLYPLYEAQMRRVLSSDYIQIDETTLRITDKPGASRKGYIWAVRSALRPGVFFHYDKDSRSRQVVLKMPFAPLLWGARTIFSLETTARRRTIAYFTPSSAVVCKPMSPLMNGLHPL